MLRAMLISEALGQSKSLAIHFDTGSVLNVVYRPTSFTIAEVQELESSTRKDPMRLVRHVLDVVESWDLQMLGEHETRMAVPLEPEPVRLNVPTKILARILRAVNEDQSAGE